MNRIIPLLTAFSLSLSGSGCTAKPQSPEPQKTETSEQKAVKVLDEMTLDEKIGQMFLVRYPGNETAANDAKEYNLGGYVLFAKDFENETPDSISDKISDCIQEAEIPLIMAVDEEGGLVNRVSKFKAYRDEPFKSPQALYKEGGFELIQSDTIEKCSLLKAIGINVNLAPVCDVSEDSTAFIYDRTFGGNAEETSEYVKTVVTTMKENNVGSALKHFPGYGNNGDTHTAIITDTRDKSEFETKDFLPFKAGIAAGANMVLVAHNIVNSMDSEYPASLSPEVHRILREELGFDGVIVTDELSMDAITKYTDGKSAAVQAVKAGNDLLCCTDYKEQIAAVAEAVKNGEISEDAINQSVKRILKMKFELGIM